MCCSIQCSHICELSLFLSLFFPYFILKLVFEIFIPIWYLVQFQFFILFQLLWFKHAQPQRIFHTHGKGICWVVCSIYVFVILNVYTTKRQCGDRERHCWIAMMVKGLLTMNRGAKNQPVSPEQLGQWGGTPLPLPLHPTGRFRLSSRFEHVVQSLKSADCIRMPNLMSSQCDDGSHLVPGK